MTMTTMMPIMLMIMMTMTTYENYVESHVQISALAAPAEAHLRIATALTEVNSAPNSSLLQEYCILYSIHLYCLYIFSLSHT